MITITYLVIKYITNVKIYIFKKTISVISSGMYDVKRLKPGTILLYPCNISALSSVKF